MRSGNEKTVITYGTFDLFHHGHRALLEHARELGDFLIVGITSDAFDRARGKFNVKQPLIERIHAVEETGLADRIVIEEFKGQKIEDIRKYGVDVFTVGSDWVGKFDYLKEYCDVVYLPRTAGVSSTELRREATREVRIACIGTGPDTDRMVRECWYVSGADMVASCGVESGEIVSASVAGLSTVGSLDELAGIADSAYVNVSPQCRSQVVRSCLDRGLHVLCEGPFAYRSCEAEGLVRLAEERGLVLMEALATLYRPAFQRLKLLLESGVVGEVKDVDASYSLVPEGLDMADPFNGSFYRMSSRALLPAMAFLGTSPEGVDIVTGYSCGFCTWSKYNLRYAAATATLKTGRGIKTEGDMTVTGTDGYVYVPAPWWLADYFEVRGEDLREVKKHYYACAGEGQRYLVKAFAESCTDRERYLKDKRELDEMELAVVRIVEKAAAGDCDKLENHSDRFGGGETVAL